MLSMRVKAFWARVRQGLTILYDRDRYLREAFAVQFVGWCPASRRSGSFWEAFNIGGLGHERAARARRERRRRRRAVHAPGGWCATEAPLVKVFAGTASGATVAAYGVGQQIAIGAFAFGVGFAALFFIFRMRSFKEIIARGREDRAAEKVSGEAAGTA